MAGPVRGAIGTFAGEGHLAEPTSASAPKRKFIFRTQKARVTKRRCN